MFMIVSLTGPDSDYAEAGVLTMAKVATAPVSERRRPSRIARGKRHLSVLAQVRQDGEVDLPAPGIPHMTKEEIEKAIRKLYAARVVGNVDAMVGAMAPDVHFGLAGNEMASPVAGRLRGTDELRSQLTKLVGAFKFNAYDIVNVVVDGPKAAVHAKANITSTATGQTVDMELADFIEFKDGSVNSFLQFCDTAMAAKLAAKP
jgi:ketosteroid isomerase-like protein